MARYVQIDKSEMDAFMEAIGFHELSVRERTPERMVRQGRAVKEAVYESEPLGAGGSGRIRIYSSVVGGADGKGRDVGKDAIRVQYWVGDQKITGSKRVHRTMNWRKNVLDRVESLRESVATGPLSRIPRDSSGDYMVVRRYKGNEFWGSSNYPRIRETARFEAASVAPIKADTPVQKAMMMKWLMDDSERQEQVIKLQTMMKLGIISEDDVLSALGMDAEQSFFSAETLSSKEIAVLNAIKNQFFVGRYEAPYEMTGRGIGEKVSMTRTHVETVLRSLIDRGLVVRQKRHVDNGPRKVWAYQITPEGQRTVKWMFAAEGRYRVGTKGQGGYSYTPLEEPCPVCGTNEENVLMIYRDDGTIETACLRGDCDMHMILMKPKSRSGLLNKMKNLFSADSDEERCPNPVGYWKEPCGKRLYSNRFISPQLRKIGGKNMMICGDCVSRESYAQGLGEWVDKYGNGSRLDAESYKPPASAVANAKRGLKLRKEWGRGGLSPSEAASQGIDSGVTRAKRIASGTVSEHDVRRMSAFNRHRKNYRPEKKESDGGPTAGTIAWLLWGGTTGVNWAKKKSATMNAETFEAYDVASWNPADEPTEEEAVWEQFYEYCPDMDLIAKLWDLEGQPGDSAESWMDSLEGTDEHENVFERHYQLIKEAAYRYWDSIYGAETSESSVVEDGCPVCGDQLSEVSDTVLECNRCEIAWDLITDEQGFEYLDSESDEVRDYGVGPTWM